MRIARNTELLGAWQKLVRDGVLPLGDALGLITGNVARVLGLQHRKGRLGTGFAADIALLDDTLQPRQTFVAGRRIFDSADQ
jgi:beta-aspartyl-dipeptidase (metallo-type)